MDGQTMLGGGGKFNPIKVGIDQFYGIEINDFAVTVAKTALWIAESQMMHETEDIMHTNIEFLPLKSYANIVEGNSLRIDWESVVPKNKLNYIMGNPPFVGYSLQSKEQKNDILSIYVDDNGKPYKTAGKIDYVAGWYFKASQLMTNTNIRTATHWFSFSSCHKVPANCVIFIIPQLASWLNFYRFFFRGLISRDNFHSFFIAYVRQFFSSYSTDICSSLAFKMFIFPESYFLSDLTILATSLFI